MRHPLHTLDRALSCIDQPGRYRLGTVTRVGGALAHDLAQGSTAANAALERSFRNLFRYLLSDRFKQRLREEDAYDIERALLRVQGGDTRVHFGYRAFDVYCLLAQRNRAWYRALCAAYRQDHGPAAFGPYTQEQVISDLENWAYRRFGEYAVQETLRQRATVPSFPRDLIPGPRPSSRPMPRLWVYPAPGTPITD